jgi:tetratricopeptide (TPR) repeat protein
LALPSGLLASGNAQIDLYSPAKISFPTLAVPVGVRAVGMGEAYTAAGNDVYALNWNPAGLARVPGFQLGLAHNEWSSQLGLRQEVLDYGMSMSQSSGFGIGIDYFSLGQLDQRASDGALQGQSGAFDFAASAGYGWSMLDQDRLKLGLNAEFGMESLFSSSQSGFGGNLGLLYEFTHDYSLGISLNHLGTGTGGFMPPSAASFGLSGLFLNHGLTVDVDGMVPFNADPLIKAGLEFNFGVLSLRGGYRYDVGAKPGDVQSGLSAGAGFKAGFFDIDYAFVPYGDLSSTHRVAATIELPADFFKPKIIGADATTTTAKSFYDKGMAFRKGGDLLQALVSFQRAEESYPEKFKGSPQKFYLETKQQIKDIQTEMNKRGGSAQLKQAVQKYLGKAQEYLDARRYKDAINELQNAKQIDPQNTEIEAKLKEARGALQEHIRGYLAEAKAADRDGRLIVALDNYIKIIKIDPSEVEANAFLNNRRTEFEAQLKGIHRKGIDLYVAGKVEEAVKVWEKGRVLDYWDSVKFERDIEKARKLLDLRGQK